MSFKVQYSAEARQDLRYIFNYIAQELLVPEEARRFALAYYGWDDEPVEYDIPGASEASDWLREMAISEELPFN